MMRAQVRDAGDQMVLQVCGRLTEGWVVELEQCWQRAKSGQPGRRFSVDLRGVTFIDEAGVQLLRSMYRDGACFETRGLLIEDVVSQVVNGSK